MIQAKDNFFNVTIIFLSADVSYIVQRDLVYPLIKR